ncbi:hypothetical protein SK128_021801, partial [Halocaridina rubra]
MDEWLKLTIHWVIGLEAWSERPDRMEVLPPTHYPTAPQDQLCRGEETMEDGSHMMALTATR